MAHPLRSDVDQVARAITWDPDNYRLMIDEQPLGYVLGSQPIIEMLSERGTGIAWIPIFVVGSMSVENDQELDCS